MGQRIRDFDWSATPLGPVEGWPSSLCTAVGIMLGSSYPMYIAWGPDFTQFYNDAYRPILGSTKHPHALGCSTRETFREIWDFIGPMFEGALHGGTATRRDDQLLPLDRFGYLENCYFTFSYSPIPTEHGHSGGVLVTCIETTARVLAERRLRTLRALGIGQVLDVDQALRHADEVLAQNDEDIPYAALYLVDEEQREATLHRAIRLEDCAARVPLEPDSDPLGVRQCVLERRPVVVGPLHIVAGPWPEPSQSAVALPILSADQRRVAAVLVAGVSARRALDEEYRGFLEQCADNLASSMAKARAFEDERRRADALAELDRAKTTFFTNISHEFRTPLTLLLGPLKEELSHDELGARTRQRLQVAARNAERLLRLVNTLLDSARLEAGGVEPARQAVDLGDITRRLAAMFQPSADDGEVSLEVDVPATPVTSFMDVDMWEKILFNLLSNAFKFTLSGKVCVRLRVDEPSVVLDVEDSGVGIPPDQLERVFERFHRVQVPSARSVEGTGIGLALVRELSEVLGGKVSVESRVGEGTRFRVTVPRLGDRDVEPTDLQPAPLAEPLAPPVADPLSRDPGRHAERILVVDDNADMRLYLAGLLERHWQVSFSQEGDDALRVARAEAPDLVLTDVMMPLLDGFALIAALRADPATREIPVLVLSARAGEEARVEGLEAGADDYLVKPFSGPELIARVRNLLAMRRMRREAHARAEEERQRLHALFTQAPALICTLRGPNHVFEFANPLYLDVIARGRAIMGRPVGEALPEVIEQGWTDLLDEVYRSGRPFSGRGVRLMLEGRELFVNFVYHPTRDEDGRVDGIFVHAVDVTDQMAALQRAELLAERLEAHQASLEANVAERTAELQTRTRELEEANARLRELDQLKSEFLATVSHELRTPLNAIIGFSEVLAQLPPELWTTDAPRTYLRHISEGGEMLLSLVNDVLDLARIEAGRLHLDVCDFSLRDVVAEAITMIGSGVSAKTLSMRVKGDDIVVRADPQRLRQVIINLLSNAVKFSPLGGNVYIDVAEEDGHVRVGVRDEGAGIAEQEQDEIFMPFQSSTPGTAREIGSGLGLAISKRLVEAHGGRISFTSRRGEGSTFTFWLPRHARSPEQPTGGAAPTPGWREKSADPAPG